jgi:hypothetical protein
MNKILLLMLCPKCEKCQNHCTLKYSVHSSHIQYCSVLHKMPVEGISIDIINSLGGLNMDIDSTYSSKEGDRRSKKSTLTISVNLPT